MSLDVEGVDPVHMPRRREVFSFDNEVAEIFDNMAVRSIPMYGEVHRLHVSLLQQVFVPGATVIDVGSSTGKLFNAIEQQLGTPIADSKLRTIAVDSSAPMMDKLRERYPTVDCRVADITESLPIAGQADIMFALYVLQFVPPERKLKALEWMLDSMADDGILILGQKEAMVEPVDSLFADEYYRFRLDNNYTMEEIKAKTTALKNSMWPVPNQELVHMLYGLGVSFVIETSRWLQFSTLMVVK